MPSMVTNYTHFIEQSLACYRALIETKYLTMSHQVTLQPELLYINWVLSDPHDFTGEFYLGEVILVSHKLFKRKEKQGPHQTYFMKTS